MAETGSAAPAASKMAVKVKKRVPRPPARRRVERPRRLCDISMEEAETMRYVQSLLPLFTAKRWLILPPLHCGVERYIFLMNQHDTPNILQQIRRDTLRIKAYPPQPQLFTTPYDVTEAMLRQAKNIALVNTKVRNRMQTLARRWKTRRLKQANTEDLLTGEEPKQCIRLRDYENRSEYVFEADTIHKDMYERLLHSYYTFPEPQAPRNPYTNELLTFTQFFNVMTQLYQVPGKKVHWALDALFSCSYDLPRFQNIMASRLRQSLIQRIMSNPTNEIGTEVLADFIEDCFEATILITSEELIKNRILLYRWAARNLVTHPQVCRWRTACYTHQLQRINAIPPTLQQKDALNRDIARLILETPHPDVKNSFDSSPPPPAAPVAALNDEDSHAWEEEFGINQIYIITSDTTLFEIDG